MKLRIGTLSVLAFVGCGVLLLSGAGGAGSPEFPAHLKALYRDLAGDAVPVPQWLRVLFDGNTAGLGGMRMGAGGVKEIVVGKDATRLADDELQALLAHFMGHVILSHRHDVIKSDEKAAMEAGAHIYAAELMSRRGMKAEAYVKALKTVTSKHKHALCDPASGLGAVEKLQEAINGIPNTLLYLRLALRNGEFDAAYDAYRHLTEALKPYEDPLLLNTLGWLSLMRIEETNAVKLAGLTDSSKPTFDARYLYARAYVVPQKPMKLRSAGDDLPRELTDALKLFKRANELAPYWLAPGINRLYALDMAVHLHGGTPADREEGTRLATAMKLSALTAGQEEKVSALNAAGVWLANEGKHQDALAVFESARAAVPCGEEKVPNAWTTCWNGWLAETEGLMKAGAAGTPVKFTKDAVIKSITASSGGHGVLSTICKAMGVPRPEKEAVPRAKAWNVVRGKLPPELIKDLTGTGAVRPETLEKFSQWLEKDADTGAVFQAENGSILMARSQSAITIILRSESKDGSNPASQLVGKIDSKECAETKPVPGGSAMRERCCMKAEEGKVSMDCVSGQGRKTQVILLQLNPSS